MFKAFYGFFYEIVEKILENVDWLIWEWVFGKDLEFGCILFICMICNGFVVQIGVFDELDEDEKFKYVNFCYGQFMEIIIYEEVFKLFELFRDIGEYEGELV